jgi:hypothetical protein
MATEVNLLDNRIQIVVDGALVYSGTYSNITKISPRMMSQKSYAFDPPTVLFADNQLLITDRTNYTQRIQLGRVDNKAGWTNDEAGYEQAESDIYAAFP